MASGQVAAGCGWRSEAQAEEDRGLSRQHLALYDDRGSLVYSTRRPVEGLLREGDGETGIQVDRAGRVFVPFLIGAHASYLVVLDAGSDPVRTFDSVPGSDGDAAFTANSPGAYATDYDGDGVNEIVLPQNDYDPSYAEGTVYEHWFAYEAASGRFEHIGCREDDGSTAGTGPALRPGEPGCVV